MIHLKLIEKQEQANHKSNELETKKKIQQISETKCCVFEKMNKIDLPLAKLTKRIKKTKINKMRKEILQ
jgi:hypothetical protein